MSEGNSVAYLVLAGSVLFGIATCVGAMFAIRIFRRSLEKAANDPDRMRRAASLPRAYRIVGIISNFALVISVLAFANSAGQSWLIPYRSLTIVIAALSAVCWIIVYLRAQR
jgi:amino acid transporter